MSSLYCKIWSGFDCAISAFLSVWLFRLLLTAVKRKNKYKKNAKQDMSQSLFVGSLFSVASLCGLSVSLMRLFASSCAIDCFSNEGSTKFHLCFFLYLFNDVKVLSTLTASVSFLLFLIHSSRQGWWSKLSKCKMYWLFRIWVFVSVSIHSTASIVRVTAVEAYGLIKKDSPPIKLLVATEFIVLSVLFATTAKLYHNATCNLGVSRVNKENLRSKRFKSFKNSESAEESMHYFKYISGDSPRSNIHRNQETLMKRIENTHTANTKMMNKHRMIRRSTYSPDSSWAKGVNQSKALYSQHSPQVDQNEKTSSESNRDVVNDALSFVTTKEKSLQTSKATPEVHPIVERSSNSRISSRGGIMKRPESFVAFSDSKAYHGAKNTTESRISSRSTVKALGTGLSFVKSASKGSLMQKNELHSCHSDSIHEEKVKNCRTKPRLPLFSHMRFGSTKSSVSVISVKSIKSVKSTKTSRPGQQTNRLSGVFLNGVAFQQMKKFRLLVFVCSVLSICSLMISIAFILMTLFSTKSFSLFMSLFNQTACSFIVLHISIFLSKSNTNHSSKYASHHSTSACYEDPHHKKDKNGDKSISSYAFSHRENRMRTHEKNESNHPKYDIEVIAKLAKQPNTAETKSYSQEAQNLQTDSSQREHGLDCSIRADLPHSMSSQNKATVLTQTFGVSGHIDVYSG